MPTFIGPTGKRIYFDDNGFLDPRGLSFKDVCGPIPKSPVYNDNEYIAHNRLSTGNNNPIKKRGGRMKSWRLKREGNRYHLQIWTGRKWAFWDIYISKHDKVVARWTLRVNKISSEIMGRVITYKDFIEENKLNPYNAIRNSTMDN